MVFFIVTLLLSICVSLCRFEPRYIVSGSDGGISASKTKAN